MFIVSMPTVVNESISLPTLSRQCFDFRADFDFHTAKGV